MKQHIPMLSYFLKKQQNSSDIIFHILMVGSYLREAEEKTFSP